VLEVEKKERRGAASPEIRRKDILDRGKERVKVEELEG